MLNSLLLHLLVLSLTLLSCLCLRRFLAHFYICWLLLWLCSTLTFLSRLFLFLFSLFCLFFFLFFLFRNCWHWEVKDSSNFCFQGFELIFYLFDGVAKVLSLRFLKSCVNSSEVGVNNFDFINDVLLSLFSEIWCLACRCFGKLWLYYTCFELVEEIDPLSNLASKPVSCLHRITNSTEGSHTILILLERSLLSLSIDPVNSRLEVLQECILQCGVNIVLIIAIRVTLTFHIIRICF